MSNSLQILLFLLRIFCFPQSWLNLFNYSRDFFRLIPENMKSIVFTLSLAASIISSMNAQKQFEPDEFTTSGGKLTIYFIGHGTLMFDFNGKIIHVDPWTKLADYSKLPKADLILVTHQHGDHLDTTAIKQITKKGTNLVSNAVVIEMLNKGEEMKNGDIKTFQGIKIEAVPAYNTTPGKEKFHPMGRDNGYVINFGNRLVYVAGDTEDIPEMAFLKEIYIAFLPMNQPYTMLPEQVVKAANMFHPKILYPYHYGDSNIADLEKLMASSPDIELRIKPMK